MKILRLAALTFFAACGACTQTPPPQEISAPPMARNVILFIGDGMGISTITAARIYDGQSRGEPGEENALSFEKFPQVALVKTYKTNQQVPDSAGTATAMATGVKTRAGVIGVGPAAHRGNCAESLAAQLPQTAAELHAAGKSVGIVTTARITHATPASFYAHSPERDWESDADIPAGEAAAGCRDIASQLLGYPFDTALGGGAREFLGTGKGGKRLVADADLGAEWAQRTGGTYVTGRDALASAPAVKPLLGLFSPSHMTYSLERESDSSEPTLTEMTRAAIARAKRDEDGYFLMIEAGRIDHGHHDGRADLALSETQELSRAVEAALAMIDPAETLVLVTADHSHVFTIAGYATRGNPILGLSQGNDASGEPAGEPTLAEDGKPYTTLGYANGPGAIDGRRDGPRSGAGVLQQAVVPLESESHGGEDVALFATGPGSQRVHGVIEQNLIDSVIREATGLPAR